MSSFVEDTPPNSRLFIVCSKQDDLTQDDFQNAFSKFGAIEDVWFVRDKATGQPRGLCYIKFSKSSEACLALEEMNGQCIPKSDKPLKIIIAANRNEGNVRRDKDGESLNRIFIVVPQDATVESIRSHFSRFGTIDDVLMVRNNRFAYISFSKASEAAMAIESCDRMMYKPKIADPPGGQKKRQQQQQRERSRSPVNNRRNSYYDDFAPSYGGGSNSRYFPPTPQRQEPLLSSRIPTQMPPPEGTVDLSVCLINNPTRCSQLYLKVNYPLTREMVWKICNLIPGLEYVELHQEAANAQKTIAYIRYENAASAAWAWEKLQDFEYPPGYVMRVRYADAGFPSDWQAEYALTTGFHYQQGVLDRGTPLDAYNGGGQQTANTVYIPNTTATLGKPQKILGRGVLYVDRAFVVCTNRIPMSIMEDAFSSFGDLIEFYYVGNKNCGFATYASKESVDKAIGTLNGEMLYGERLKVVRAEPEPNRGDRDSKPH